MAPRDFNNLNVWIPKQIDRWNKENPRARQLTIEVLAQKINLTRTAVYSYMADLHRPSEKAMLKMAHVLGVEFEEGLKQYTPRKAGRPAGRKSETTREVRTRGK